MGDTQLKQLLQITDNPRPNPIMTIQVEGHALPFLVDIGATFSMITAETALKLPNLAYSGKTQKWGHMVIWHTIG